MSGAGEEKIVQSIGHDIKKLKALAEEFSASAAEQASMLGIEGAPVAPAPLPKGCFSAAQAAHFAGKQLDELTRLKVDSVSAVSKIENGWDVVVNLIELSRIPHSTDVLSSYSVILDADGNLSSYRRITRYMRDQLGDDL
jgi:hypothetical protein